MSILQSILYGLLSGITEFLPVSSQGHQALLRALFGQQSPDPFRSLLIHGAMILALVACCGTYIQRLRRDSKVRTRPGRGSARSMDHRSVYDLRFIRSATLPMVIFSFIYIFTRQFNQNLAVVALFFVLNGIAVYAPEHLPYSNKDADRMSPLDSFLVGLSGGLSLLPGMSRIGATYSCIVAKGGDREKAVNWVLVLSVPALLFLMVFDVIDLISYGFGAMTPGIFAGIVLSALMAFFAACAGIFLLRFLTVRSGITVFGFYSWGAALLSLILYLTA